MARKRRARIGLTKKLTKPANENFKDISLLKQGFVPEETKVGTQFKGKNKVIVV